MPPLLMCLVEEQSHNRQSDVRIGIITVCPSTGDVVWDDFEGEKLHFIMFINSLIWIQIRLCALSSR